MHFTLDSSVNGGMGTKVSSYYEYAAGNLAEERKKKRLFTDNRVVKKEISFFVDAINNVL